MRPCYVQHRAERLAHRFSVYGMTADNFELRCGGRPRAHRPGRMSEGRDYRDPRSSSWAPLVIWFIAMKILILAPGRFTS